MPWTPRLFVEGGIYHVYNRFASGEGVFADPEAAVDFVELLRFIGTFGGTFWQPGRLPHDSGSVPCGARVSRAVRIRHRKIHKPTATTSSDIMFEVFYRLFETHFDEVRGQWEERFEWRCGFWRGFVDEQVRRYLDCGLFENGFARIRCPDCAEEYLLAFSCKTRELCPSCAAKRSAATASLLAEEVFEEVGHAQWVLEIS